MYIQTHVYPLQWIPDLEFNAFLFRITSQECGTRATSLITLRPMIVRMFKRERDDGIQTLLGVIGGCGKSWE